MDSDEMQCDEPSFRSEDSLVSDKSQADGAEDTSLEQSRSDSPPGLLETSNSSHQEDDISDQVSREKEVEEESSSDKRASSDQEEEDEEESRQSRESSPGLSEASSPSPPPSSPPPLPDSLRDVEGVLDRLETYTTVIPDSVLLNILQQSGFRSDDAQAIKLISLAAQKFVSDVSYEALQHCKMRGGGKGRKKVSGKDRKYCLGIDDLQTALSDQGITLKKPPYYS